jgi:sugar transferase (PEP-CTERM/EpsH1 system associated)
MNVVMLYHRLPFPPNKGEKMRAFQQVRHISAHHRVWLACFADTPQDRKDTAEVQRMCHRVEVVPLYKSVALSRGGLDLLRGGTMTEGYYSDRAMDRVIESFSEDGLFDVGFAFSSSMARYLEQVPAHRHVLDMNDFDSHKWSNYAERSAWPMSEIFAAESRRLAQREREMIDRFDLTLMVNERECRRCGGPHPALQALSTPMDADSYAIVDHVPQDKIVAFVGTLNYRPNAEAIAWFAEHVWDAVHAQHPDATWWIIGRHPGRAIRSLDGRNGIVVHGAVPEIRDYLRRVRVFVAPTRTDIGVQTKVLEALAAGRPTVISDLGHAGVNAPADVYRVAADGPQFAEAVNGLLSDYDQCVSMSAAGRSFVRTHYDLPEVMPTFEKLLCGQQGAATA